MQFVNCNYIMIRIIFICFIVFFAGKYAHGSDNSVTKVLIKKRNVLYLKDSELKDTSDNSFIKFWTKFRNAIINDDTSLIKKYVKFPLKARGPLDSDPLIRYSENKFIRVFHLYLLQSNGLNTGSELDEIKQIIVPSNATWEKINARVGNMEFKKIAGEWKLVFLYLEYDSIDAIRK